ncbi:MAG: hypothetical protein V3W05_07880 [candidate division NC10 bacterium]
MHRVFANEGGFEDKELRTIQSTIKRGAYEEPSPSEPTGETSAKETPAARAKQEKAA